MAMEFLSSACLLIGATCGLTFRRCPQDSQPCRLVPGFFVTTHDQLPLKMKQKVVGSLKLFLCPLAQSLL